MRLGGLGQLWQTLLKLLSIMFVCQLLSPVVAFIAILLVGPGTVVSSEVSEVSEVTREIITSTTEKATEVEVTTSSEDSCCVAGESLCPRDHRPDPSQCQNSSQPCSELPLACLQCSCDYNCHYGQTSTASCQVRLVHSHWSSSYITALSLVQSFRVLKYFHGVATPTILCH